MDDVKVCGYLRNEEGCGVECRLGQFGAKVIKQFVGIRRQSVVEVEPQRNIAKGGDGVIAMPDEEVGIPPRGVGSDDGAEVLPHAQGVDGVLIHPKGWLGEVVDSLYHPLA